MSEGFVSGFESVPVFDPDAPHVSLAVPGQIGFISNLGVPYETGLKNDGADAGTVTEWICFGPDLADGDLTYESQDEGVWSETPLTEADGQLCAELHFPILAGLDATSYVRVTVSKDIGDEGRIYGESTILSDADDSVLAYASYAFVQRAKTEDTVGVSDPVARLEPAGQG